ncbi:hypothetical protein DPMN_136027 [Dreissena polymorpha]|uniref:Uncharacterized protein n=1 Tax=Dreissena polymorpha TaxID=45954 RepID=A0A9D4JDE9_DREPO|nr:hypothetical protein DPMN_136027 [Dreissena polymorpha]
MDAAMYMAVQNNEPTTLRQLIDSGADVNEYYQDMTLISAKSILHMCCEKGRYDCVKVILCINLPVGNQGSMHVR